LFDWALIFLSSVSGAILVSRSLPLEPKFAMLVFLFLTVLGIFVQSRFLAPATVVEKEKSGG
jgi:hypothetical protein